MGARSYTLIEKYKDFIKGDLVEIGSERGEGSTQFFSNFAKENNLNFYSIDFEKGAYERAESIIGENAYCMTGEDFLDNVYKQKESKIGAAYLDNFDFCYPNLVGSQLISDQSSLYDQYGIKLNNDNSKLAHLNQTKKIIENYIDGFCLLMFDDTYINTPERITSYRKSKMTKKEQLLKLDYDGKGGTAVPYLLNKGWKPVDYNFNGSPNDGFIFLSNE